MEVSEEAVKAAKEVLYYANPNDVERALTAALPFLPVQGAVKKLEWTKGVVDIASPHPGMKYVACSTTPKGSWAFWLDHAPETRSVFTSEEAAKAAAQADYSARILSALEPSAGRAAVLEEALRNLLHAVCGETGFASAVRQESGHDYPWPALDIAEASAIRSLSSPDHADAGKVEGDGWLPIETAPKDGTEFIGWDGKWAFRCSAGKQYVLYPYMDGGPTYRDVWDGHYYDSLTIERPTHWRPLPSAPSEGAE